MAETRKKTSSTQSRSSSSTSRSRAKTQVEKEKQKALEAQKKEELRKKKKRHDDIVAIVIIVAGVFLLLSLLGYTGIIGSFLSKVLFGLFGRFIAWVVPSFFILYGILVFARKTSFLTITTAIIIVLMFILASTLAAIPFVANYEGHLADEARGFAFLDMADFFKNGKYGGGMLGTPIAYGLINLVGKVGLYLIGGAGILIAVLFIFDTPISEQLDNLKIKMQARKALRAEMAEQAEEAQVEFDLENAEKIRNQVQVQETVRAEALTEKQRARAEAKSNAFAVAAMETMEADYQAKQRSKSMGLSDADNASPTPKETAEAQRLKEEAEAAAKLEAERKAAAEEAKKNADKNGMPVLDVFGSAARPQASELTKEDIGIRPGDDDYYADNQKKILDYVNDDSLFRTDKKSGTGLNGDVRQPEEINELSEAKEVKEASKPEPEKPKKAESSVHAAKAAAAEATAAAALTLENEKNADPNAYTYPPIELLKKPAIVKNSGKEDPSSSQATVLEEALASFGVKASVVNVTKGPAVTRYEVQPASGVKVSSIVRLQDDIALNLRAKSLRIEAPIPGKAAIGIEVSNDEINTVLLREVLESKAFRDAGSKISMGLGRSISGEPVVADLKKMPHMLIAGATGSGKSVCINSIIISLLYKSSPEEVKLILVDPKVVELSNYNGIPHLMIPVVTDPNKAAAALNWAVAEMNDRYNKFSQEGVRDLQSYNDLMRANSDTDKVMPQVVIIVDELADLMMSAQNSVEDSICRLAQKARAAGMHLILATQRPSVDVITGVIKANIPSRIAFAVSSHIDSRTILDEAGAEKLLGRGDMLYAPQGVSKP
ncbi:MAG: DNA translocase FtsK 4TM domain-containing protein, partial [Firmicutes bacterium]|nr:DNA translocase FtsK 4TM domain-containing protein [Bacillota bacterium]